VKGGNGLVSEGLLEKDRSRHNQKFPRQPKELAGL
jgi:hypothetical protein